MLWDLQNYLEKLDDFNVLDDVFKFIQDKYPNLYDNEDIVELKSELREKFILREIKRAFPLKSMERKKNDIETLKHKIEVLKTDNDWLQIEIEQNTEKIVSLKKDLDELMKHPPIEEKVEDKPKKKRAPKKKVAEAETQTENVE